MFFNNINLLKKKHILLLFLFIFLLEPLTSQISFKTFLGGQIAWLDHGLNDKLDVSDQQRLNALYEPVLLPYLGFQSQIKLNGKIDLNIECQLVYKGQNSNFYNHFEKSLYVEFIPYVDFNFWNEMRFGIGPYIGLKIKNGLLLNNTTQSLPRNNWDYGGMVSLAYVFERFTFRVVYFHSVNTTISFIFQKNNGNNFVYGDNKNRVFQIGIGYTI